MNDSHYAHDPARVPYVDLRRFHLRDAGLSVPRGARVVVDVRAAHDEWSGRPGTVAGFLDSKPEPIASVQLDDGEDILVPCRALRRVGV